jgi:hypothetical protein
MKRLLLEPWKGWGRGGGTEGAESNSKRLSISFLIAKLKDFDEKTLTTSLIGYANIAIFHSRFIASQR